MASPSRTGSARGRLKSFCPRFCPYVAEVRDGLGRLVGWARVYRVP